MRLIDLVVATNKPMVIALKSQNFLLPDASSFSNALNACALRYVLEENVHEAMETLLMQWPDLLKPSDVNLRVPAEHMWLEWQDGLSRKYGILLESSPSGRSGTIRSFWENGGEAQVSQVSVEFDLDNEATVSGVRSFRLTDIRPTILDLDRHISIVIDQEWYRYFYFNGHPIRNTVQECTNIIISDVYRIFAFSRIISSRIKLSQRHISRYRINVARAKSQKKPLLDHIELSINMDQRIASRQVGYVQRAASRLHVVRGHLVRKGGKLFWRSTHLRGKTGAGEPIKRTTTVR